MLLSLFPELRVLVLRKLCVRDLVRLSRASKQLNALCVDVGERAVQEMIAAGEDDAPLPAGLSEHVLHRLARLCGVCFVTAAFADAVIDATTDLRTDATWDLAALEKAYVVLSDRELERHEPNLVRRTKWRFKVEPHLTHRAWFWESPDAANGAYNFISTILLLCEHDRDTCIARKHVDRAIDLLRRQSICCDGERSMARSRRLMERATNEDDPNDVDALIDATAREQKDEELDLAREDKLGVLIGNEWWPSFEAFFSKSHVDLSPNMFSHGNLYYEKVRPDLDADPDIDSFRPWFEDDEPAPCSNPLCCHTWRNIRVDRLRNDLGNDRSQERFSELLRAPNTGRLRAFDCPRGLKQRAARAEFRKWRRESRKNAKAVLASLGFAVVEGVPMGDAYERSDLPNLLAWSF